MTGPRATVRAVAAAAGVAPSTASLILRGEGRFAASTVTRVLGCAASLGYRVGDRLVMPLEPGSTNVAGFVTFASLSTTLRDPHTQELLRGLHHALGKAGMSVMLLPPIDGPGFASAVTHMPLDVICVPSIFADLAPLFALARHRGLGVAHLESGGDDPQPTMVPVDDAAAMRELGAHLLSVGHRRIAVITLRFSSMTRTGLVPLPQHGRIVNAVVRARLEGLERAGLTPAYVYETASVSSDECTAAVSTLMRLAEPPTAIVCQSDALAEATIAALLARGLRVPDDVSVTGYDGVDTATLAPGFLTTIRQDGKIKGALLAAAALALRAGKPPLYTPLRQHLRIGSSVGPPRG